MFIPFSRRPLVVKFAGLAFYCMTMLVLSVVMAARIGTVRPILNLPKRYLPGNPLPEVAFCPPGGYEDYPCIAYHQNKKITLTYSGRTGSIIFTAVSGREYTIGELITAWGTPTGITQRSYDTDVYWGTRSAFLMTSSFQPDSRVDWIMYRLEPDQSSPWRGFTSGKG